MLFPVSSLNHNLIYKNSTVILLETTFNRPFSLVTCPRAIGSLFMNLLCSRIVGAKFYFLSHIFFFLGGGGRVVDERCLFNTEQSSEN